MVEQNRVPITLLRLIDLGEFVERKSRIRVISTQGTYLNVQNVLVDFFCFGELPRFLLDYRDVQPREESVAIVGAKSSTHDLSSGAIKCFRFIVLLFLLEN